WQLFSIAGCRYQRMIPCGLVSQGICEPRMTNGLSACSARWRFRSASSCAYIVGSAILDSPSLLPSKNSASLRFLFPDVRLAVGLQCFTAQLVKKLYDSFLPHKLRFLVVII